EKNSSSKCLPCKADEYIEYPNDFSKCLGCRTCREDQVELSPCRAVSDTQCVCKNGTFCSPDHPCEMCQKCRPRCPKDEVEQAPCTPHSDRQCGPPTGTFSSNSSKADATAVMASLRGQCEPCPYWDRPTQLVPASLLPQDYLVRQLTRYQSGGLETQDNDRNAWLSHHQLLPRASGSVTPSAPGPEVRERAPLLRPVPFHPLVLRCSVDIFARYVPCKDWKRYGRALGLLENDIALAEMNDKYSLEPFFQMLNTWQNRQGMNASVNTLLDTLHQINLRGIAEDISSKLVQQGFFQYEVS
ncbi:TR10B factor, partial [Anhinga anhinga]|nr:TR10B factor [Anhinga anhinga]